MQARQGAAIKNMTAHDHDSGVILEDGLCAAIDRAYSCSVAFGSYWPTLWPLFSTELAAGTHTNDLHPDLE